MRLLMIDSLLILALSWQCHSDASRAGEAQGTLDNKEGSCQSREKESTAARESCGSDQKEQIQDRLMLKDGEVGSLSQSLTTDEGEQDSSDQDSFDERVIFIDHAHSHQSSSVEGEQYKNSVSSSKQKPEQYWDGSVIPREEKDQSTATPRRNNKQDAVWVLQQEGDFEAFTTKASVVIVYFYKNSGSPALLRFLREYSKSANELTQYKVLLATVDCGKYQVSSYCTSDKISRFAYGFRGGQEKIAFPLDTLFNSNAIVASALHLALINTVPILQTAGERRNLEKRCRGHCDLVFAYLRTLGTLEHRTFLEVAHAHQSSFVFAITTYTAGTLGLPPTPHHEDEDQEKGVWVIHCQDKTVTEECVVSNYRGKMVLQQLLHFIHVLQLPLWHEVSEVSESQELETPYDQVDLPWVVLLHDNMSGDRVRILAPSLAQLLHGSVAVITMNIESISKKLLMKLGVNDESLSTPALAFMERGEQSSTTLLNDYDDALEWVKEQLALLHQKEPQSKEEQGYLPVQVVEELQQDDEVVLGVVEKESFAGIVSLAGPSPYHAALKQKKLAVFVFFLAWDPASNALLQHLSSVAHLLDRHNSHAALYSINCFDWPGLCASQGISTYPVLRLHPYGRRNMTYNGPINYHHIMKNILIVERVTPVELTTVRDVEDMLALKKEVHPASSFTNSAVVGLFSKEEDSSTFRDVCHQLEGTQLFGIHISQEAVNTYCVSEEGCVVVSKPGDAYQPWRTLEASTLKSPAVTTILTHATLNVMEELDPERYSAVHAGKEDLSDSPANQHLVILFRSSPAFQSGQVTPQNIVAAPASTFKENKRRDDMLTTIGYIAAEMSEPGFIFSWLMWDDPLAQQLGPVYGLSMETQAVVDLNVEEGSVHVFPQGNTTRAFLRAWLMSVREGHIAPSVMLPKKNWEPRLPGFDFIRFMQEDQDNDAEDHLVMEMEADLTSKLHEGERSSSSKMVHEEL